MGRPNSPSAPNAGPPPRTGVCSFGALVLFLSLVSSAWATEPCRLQVVEKGSRWPVPLIELRTVSKARFVTDNDGVIAFDLPEAMGRETWLEVIGHGYEVARDGFGNRGIRLTPQPGATVQIEVTRTLPAKRLGRLTGSGLFAESQKLGARADWPESGLVGCDSVQIALHRGRLFWAWGDTLLAKYPLGIYSTTSATTAPQPLRVFQPPLELTFDHFRDPRGDLRGVAQIPGSGPTWISGYVSLPDRAGVTHLVCTYHKISGHLDVYEIGLAVWNDDRAEFEPLRPLWKASEGKPKPPAPEGHPALLKDPSGQEWLYFGDPFPTLRLPATFEAWQDQAQWEPLTPQKTVPGAGAPITPHTGSIAWSPWRQHWVTVFVQRYGKPSSLGEVWYAEAEAPTGPWGPAVKILTHDNYTFYNPRLHPELTPPDSSILLFEGTYTAEFADHAAPTPRYDYNQILYRLDLDDPALAPAHPPK